MGDGMKYLITTLLVVFIHYSQSAFAHPGLLLDQVEQNKKIAEQSELKVNPDTGEVKFEIEPNFIKGSPVHEKMTQVSISLSRVHGRPFKYDQDLPYLKGIFWNDDPEKMLCPWCDYLSTGKWGVSWAANFLNAKEEATRLENPVFFSNGDALLGRSHFGDMQFIHAMAVRDGIPAKVTLNKILMWAEFTYKVAIAEIAGDTRISDVPVKGFPELFSKNADIYNKDIISLFHSKNVERIALGSLLHLIQDSFSLSHVDREVLDNKQIKFCRTRIKAFRSYARQDSAKHAKQDVWPANLDASSIDEMMCDPVSIGAKILQFYAEDDYSGANWEKVREFLLNKVFSLKSQDALSGPGKEFLP